MTATPQQYTDCIRAKDRKIKALKDEIDYLRRLLKSKKLRDNA